MTNNPCTPNAIEAIYNERPIAAPILQVLNTKPMPQAQPGAATRYRVLFSDGVHVLQGILGTPLNPLVESKALKKYTIIKLNKHTIRPISGKKLILAVDLDILDHFGEIEKIGEPLAIDGEVVAPQGGAPTSTSGSAARPQQQQPQQQQQQFRAPQNNPYQQQMQQQQQNQQAHQPAMTPSGSPVFHISSLNPYHNRWTIMARVTQKSDIKTWSKAGGNEGKLFSMTLMDESGEIKVTGFNQQVDDFYHMIEEGKVYYLSTAKVEIAKKQFSTVKNDYEIILQRDSQIQPAEDGAHHVPTVRYEFVQLANLANLNEKDLVDVIAIVTEVGEFTNTTNPKTGRPMLKRNLTLIDPSGFTTTVTLWGHQAETFALPAQNSVIAMKGVSVSNYGGKTLNAFGGSSIKINPEIEEAFKLRGWFKQEGSSTHFQAHTSEFKSNSTPRMTFDEVKNASANLDPTQTLYFETKGTIVMMSKSENTFQYPACPTAGCNKKVMEDTNGWRCENCNKTVSEPDYRYIMGVNVSDHTGQEWIQAFNDSGKLITGRPAAELVAHPDEVTQTFARATFKSYVFKCRAKQDTYRDEARTRITIVTASPLDWVAESQTLLKQLEEYDV
ncbi:Replication factor A protein 1 [Linnemannia schmuckeri]|uniref:Replication protein A subunit n=1 Tax=Linnemannia schmuckeri TaxID=64567 RepID=A0A9P5S7F5_9FUNG|nr:Replication factor A protein 1 [Linnemannia schmuckeri]